MTKPRPVEVHVNSFGKKQYRLQDIISTKKKYLFYPLSGKEKTKLYQKGMLDGRKEAICMYDEAQTAMEEAEHSVLAVEHRLIRWDIDPNRRFLGKLSLEKTYIFSAKESLQFVENECAHCEFLGEQYCYQKGYHCAEQDRAIYKEMKNVHRSQRRRKIALPN